MVTDWLIIPDVHGRQFWRYAVEGHENDSIIFLGDYLDPYTREGITPDEATLELQSILDFKIAHPGNVVLLLGNHDLRYLCPIIGGSRYDILGAAKNKELLEGHLDLFQLIHEIQTEKGKVLFSHAGVSKGWIKENDWLFDVNSFEPAILNQYLHDSGYQDKLMFSLAQVSFYRGGFAQVSSCIWSDIHELIDRADLLDGYTHIFGHTQNIEGAIKINSGDNIGWCLDCSRAFKLDGLGNISEI